MNYMTVNDAKIYKADAEKRILEILEELERDIGCPVDHLSMISSTGSLSSNEGKCIIGVIIHLEI